MPLLMELRRAVAKRVREIAEGRTSPADKAAAEAYAEELERSAEEERTAVNKRVFFIDSDKRDK